MDSWVWIPGFDFLGLDSRVWIPDLDSWVWVPGFGFLGFESWAWIPGLRFLGPKESWVWNPGLGFLDLDSWLEPITRSDYTYDLEPSVAISRNFGVKITGLTCLADLTAENAWIRTRTPIFDAPGGRRYRN